MENGIQVAGARSGSLEYQILAARADRVRHLAKERPRQSARTIWASPGVPGCNHGAGRHVGVDHRNAEFGEALADRALAAGDAAGEADSQARGSWLNA